MKILYFSRDYTTHDRRFLCGIAKSRHNIYFLRLEDCGKGLEKRDLPENITCLDWEGGKKPCPGPDSWFRLLPALKRVLDELKPDLIHAGPIQSCAFMAAICGFHPLLAMSWGSDILLDAEQDNFWRWITEYSLQRANYLLCDCDAVKNKAATFALFSSDQIIQFPWGIDLKQFSSSVLPLPRLEGWEESTIIISTRSWEPVYGIDVVLESFALAYEQNQKLRLLLLGGGSLGATVEQIIKMHKLQEVVLRPGIVNYQDLPQYFRTADIYLSACYSDGSSVSLLEAMASGAVPVVTDAPGNREWIEQGKNGWLVKPGAAGEFGRALLEAASLSAEKLKLMLKLNRRICEERADWAKNIRKLIAVYDMLDERRNE